LNANNVTHVRTRTQESESCGRERNWYVSKALEATNDEEEGAEASLGLWSFVLRMAHGSD
jgi:hypothetical protein